MLEELKIAVSEGPEVPWELLGIRLVLSLAAGFLIAWMYRRTHDGSGAQSLPATLVLLAVLIAAVTQVIGNNVARAFSLVGALSIVRFRTVVRDTRDTAFVIFAVVVGMAIGAAHARVALITLAVGALAAWIMKPKPAARVAAQEFKLTVRVALGVDAETLTREVFRKHLTAWSGYGAATARQGSAVEVAWLVTSRPTSAASAIVHDLNRLEGVQAVELQPMEEMS